MPAASPRRVAAVILAVAVLAAAALDATPAPAASDERLNFVVILTDDQSFDTFPSYPPALPWLQSQVQDPDGHWLWFPDAFIQTPLCCPSRATILSGLDSRHTHVRTNDDGARFDDTQTIATWLHGAGYFTGLIGKYLNRYPFGRGPYIPPGWDRWVVKRNTAATTTYSNFGFVDQGVALQTSDAPATYATDLFADHAVDFLRTAPDDRPFFLYFATSAPHPPWTPPLRHVGAFADVPMPVSPSVVERNVSDKPAWVRKLRAGRRLGAGRLHPGSATRGRDPARRGRRGRTDRRAAPSERRAGAHGDPVPHRQRLLVRPAPDPRQALPVRGVHPDAVRGEGARSARARRPRTDLQRRSRPDDRGPRRRRTGAAGRRTELRIRAARGTVARTGRRLPGLGGRPRDPCHGKAFGRSISPTSRARTGRSSSTT